MFLLLLLSLMPGDDTLSKHGTVGIMNHFVIELRPNETAIIDCSSHDILTDVYNSGVQCDSKPVDHFKGYMCRVRIPYSEEPRLMKCFLQEFPMTHVPVAVVPRTKKRSTVEVTTDLEWWCLFDYNINEVNAGHLIWMNWWLQNTTGDNLIQKKLQRVERVAVWDFEKGEEFSCNGTIWRWGTEFPCLKLLPTGMFSFTHCHMYETGGIVVLVIVLYVFLYVLLILLFKGWTMFRVRAKKETRVKKVRPVSLVTRCVAAPYSQMPDIRILEETKGDESSSNTINEEFSKLVLLKVHEEEDEEET